MSGQDTIVSGVAGRYATALFELAEQQSAIDTVFSDLAGVSGLIDESDDLGRLVKNPMFTADDQTKAMMAILDKGSVSDLTKKFIGLIIKNRRLFALPDVIKAYSALVDSHKGVMRGEVVSAHPLSDAQIAEIQKSLNAALGKDVELTTKVDPELLGGLVVKVGSRMVDTSLRTKLQSLKVAMKEAG